MHDILGELNEALFNLLAKLKDPGVKAQDSESLSHAVLYMVSSRQIVLGKKAHLTEFDII